MASVDALPVVEFRYSPRRHTAAIVVALLAMAATRTAYTVLQRLKG